MKKIFLILILLFPFLLTAQVELKPGAKLGLNIANITNTNYDNRPDFYVGGLLSIKFSDSYTLQPELIYSRQGARLSGASNSDIELHYLSVAIANKFSLFNTSNLHAIAGLFLGYQFKDNLKPTFADILGFLFKWDIGLITGLNYELSPNFEFEARYKRGFVDLPNINLNSERDTQSNTVIQIGLNYKFDTNPVLNKFQDKSNVPILL